MQDDGGGGAWERTRSGIGAAREVDADVRRDEEEERMGRTGGGRGEREKGMKVWGWRWTVGINVEAAKGSVHMRRKGGRSTILAAGRAASARH